MDYTPTAEEMKKFKSHIAWEEGMDDSMLSFYLNYGKKYAYRATGKIAIEVAMLIASIMWEWKVPEEGMDKAIDALTPFIVQESAVEDDG
ncbi:phage gp6-like head-tail connector protein [Enterococcus dispar]|uniref:phage gp6-like head-tail connector protein n=1 Tax=Enterococcus dispar TaxID=44009 RepID=UPI0021D42480|nr:phage gp6-like head-tail connector protein [Enterococcus dispar]MCU7356812.1 phage gp6-like head-tail connector protein [Enterococcus dispar]MDT2704913.1 phage gp6-like head-tail connector protein [Enterococcus dispar]